MRTRPRSQRGLRPVRGQEEREAVGRFLMAQGWAGLHLGDTMRRLSDRGQEAEVSLQGHFGAGGQLRGVALRHGRRAHILMPLVEDEALVDQFIQDQLGSLDRLTGVEWQVPAQIVGAEFDIELRQVTAAPVLRIPERPLPPVRQARQTDAEALHLIYQQVDWMRLDSAAHWAERLSRERTWVAEIQGKPVAAARWSKSFGQLVEVGGVATHADSRLQGAATAVVLAATTAAITAGFTPVLCFSNLALAPFYYRLGFESVGRERVFHRLAPPQAGI